MTQSPEALTKKNVSKFDEDVRNKGSYEYTADRLSARMANARISEAISKIYDFSGKSVLDIGCGDGAYTLDFPALGVKNILGVDPAAAAIDIARNKSKEAKLDDIVSFKVGNIYDLEASIGTQHFDIIVLRGVLHHLPDAKKAISCIAPFADNVLVLEPNGYNPVLKVLEKVSTYHVEHEEQSFLPATIKSWLHEAGFTISKASYVNLVPFFCPDWLAKICKVTEPIIEKVPVVHHIACGQWIALSHKGIT